MVLAFVSPAGPIILTHLSSVRVTLTTGTMPGLFTKYVYSTDPPPNGRNSGLGILTRSINGGGSGEPTTTTTSAISAAVKALAMPVVVTVLLVVCVSIIAQR